MEKQIFNALKKMADKLEDKIQKREDTFFNRSEAWQDSEKGFEFRERTQELDMLLSEIQAAKDTAESLF